VAEKGQGISKDGIEKERHLKGPQFKFTPRDEAVAFKRSSCAFRRGTWIHNTTIIDLFAVLRNGRNASHELYEP
jgi:hypothetical protein